MTRLPGTLGKARPLISFSVMNTRTTGKSRDEIKGLAFPSVDLVLRDEHPHHRQIQGREFARRHRQVRQPLYGEALVQDAEAHLRWLGRQSVARFEIALPRGARCACVD